MSLAFFDPWTLPEVYEPMAPKHTHTFIFLHGRDSTGMEIASDLLAAKAQCLFLRNLPQFQSWRWVFPTSLQNWNEKLEEEVFEWFPVASMISPSYKEYLQIEELGRSVRYIHRLIDHELQYVPAENLYIGGFGQGCSVAVTALISRNIRLGGLIGFSGFMALQNETRAVVLDGETAPMAAQNLLELYKEHFTLKKQGPNSTRAIENMMLTTPVFLGHSTDDDVVDVTLGRVVRDILLGLGMHVTWKEYIDGSHRLRMTHGIHAMIEFIAKTSKSEGDRAKI